MLDAAREAAHLSSGKTKQYFEHDRLLQLALVHCVQTIGEAAARVSIEGRNTTHQLPWKQIIGMRNILVHAYFDVDLDTVWQVVKEDVPALIAQLENAIGAL